MLYMYMYIFAFFLLLYILLCGNLTMYYSYFMIQIEYLIPFSREITKRKQLQTIVRYTTYMYTYIHVHQ